MAQKTVESKVGELGSGNVGVSNQETQLPVAVKKIPLRDLHSESNIIAQKDQGNPLVLKEAVISEAAKVCGMKRPSPESQMSHQQHVPTGNGANGHLVYVRRRFEAEAGKGNHNEVTADTSNSSQLKQLGNQEDGHRPKSLSNESSMQCIPAHAPIPTASLMSIPCGKPIAVSLGNSNDKTVSEEPQTQLVRSAVTSSIQPRVNKQNWEERYLELQMYLKTLDQSSLEDHLQMLRSLSAADLNRHAVELEKRAIQLSLEQGKELQRVKALNVLGKAIKTSNGPPV